jgi:hypothetical protein
LRTKCFGNGAEKARKFTVTKPDAIMAARKKKSRSEELENETLDDLRVQQIAGARRPAGTPRPSQMLALELHLPSRSCGWNLPCMF